MAWNIQGFFWRVRHSLTHCEIHVRWRSGTDLQFQAIMMAIGDLAPIKILDALPHSLTCVVLVLLGEPRRLLLGPTRRPTTNWAFSQQPLQWEREREGKKAIVHRRPVVAKALAHKFVHWWWRHTARKAAKADTLMVKEEEEEGWCQQREGQRSVAQITDQQGFLSG